MALLGREEDGTYWLTFDQDSYALFAPGGEPWEFVKLDKGRGPIKVKIVKDEDDGAPSKG